VCELWLVTGTTGAAISLMGGRCGQYTTRFSWAVAPARHGDFVLAHDHTLYRSADGGKSWDAVLNIASPIGGGALVVPAQLVYAPAGEANRQVFLLVRIRDNVDPASERGTLYRSGDGGLTWQEVGLPEGVSPTVLTMSPNFAEDGLLFLGTADGQVRPLRTGR
jgi:photosystem II stability/assembly factor-like uncharacterized protein